VQYIHIYTHVYIYISVFVDVYVSINTHTHTRAHTCNTATLFAGFLMRDSTPVFARMFQEYVCVCLLACVRVCVCFYVREGAGRACACLFACVCVLVFVCV